MLCPSCRFDNRASVSFCEECGAKLDVMCPSCGAAMPAGGKICGSYLEPSPSAKVVGASEPYVKNYMPNIGNDYGGRMMAAGLDK